MIPSQKVSSLEDIVPYSFETVALKYPEEVKGLVSVIVPIYNTERYLREALDSVIAQTYENWEAILVNDGSSDNCSAICAEYVEKDFRFKYVCKEKNEGLLLARKTGLENSRGEFTANLDSDDYYKPQYLEKMFAKIKDCDFVWCDFDYGGKRICLKAEFSRNKSENSRNHASFGTAANKLIKRSIYAKVLFPQIHLVGGEDYVQLSQIMYHSERAEYIPEAFYFYRKESVTSSSKARGASLRRHYANTSRSAVIIYLLMKRFFNAEEAEQHPTFILYFLRYFLLSKEEIEQYKMQYMKNFIPAFLRGVKKAKDIEFYKKIFWLLACKGFALPIKIYFRIKRGI